MIIHPHGQDDMLGEQSKSSPIRMDKVRLYALISSLDILTGHVQDRPETYRSIPWVALRANHGTTPLEKRKSKSAKYSLHAPNNLDLTYTIQEKRESFVKAASASEDEIWEEDVRPKKVSQHRPLSQMKTPR